jgi:hypothetical protein
MEKSSPPIRSPLGRGIFGAVVAHFTVVLFILMFSFGATIEGLYKLWLTQLPVPIIVGSCAGLLIKILQNFIRKDISFILAGVTILISYPAASVIVGAWVFDQRFRPETYSSINLYFGLGYLLTGIVIEGVITGLIIVIGIMRRRISRFFP